MTLVVWMPNFIWMENSNTTRLAIGDESRRGTWRRMVAPHSALPIGLAISPAWSVRSMSAAHRKMFRDGPICLLVLADAEIRRSEEHTSELQSLMRISYA